MSPLLRVSAFKDEEFVWHHGASNQPRDKRFILLALFCYDYQEVGMS